MLPLPTPLPPRALVLLVVVWISCREMGGLPVLILVTEGNPRALVPALALLQGPLLLFKVHLRLPNKPSLRPILPRRRNEEGVQKRKKRNRSRRNVRGNLRRRRQGNRLLPPPPPTRLPPPPVHLLWLVLLQERNLRCILIDDCVLQLLHPVQVILLQCPLHVLLVPRRILSITLLDDLLMIRILLQVYPGGRWMKITMMAWRRL
jgi:Nucleocapsid protein N